MCPLCNAPVPVQKGEIPDVVVGAHMDKDCKYNPAQQKEKVRKLLLKSVCLMLVKLHFLTAECIEACSVSFLF